MITYRKATELDTIFMGMSFRKFLNDREGQNHALLNDPVTVAHFTENVFLPAIREDRGVFIAEEGNTYAGVLFWAVEPESPIPVRFVTAYGWGHHVPNAYRKKGVYKGLIEFGKQFMQEHGVAKVMDYANGSNPESLNHALAAGFKVSDQVVVLDL